MNKMIQELLSNRILLTGVAAWALSQILKVFIHRIVTGKFVLERFSGDGGMPSSHSATVTSVAVASGLMCGWDSPSFAIALIMAVVVMHDAMGVRLETGKQAKAINEIIEHILMDDAVDLTPDKVLKEFVGHTPLQVLVGSLLGLAVALAINL